MGIRQFLSILGAKYKCGHTLDKNFEKKNENVDDIKKGGHSVRDCRKFVVNYSKRGDLGEKELKKGI